MPVRADGRQAGEIRPVTITPDFLSHPEGSVLIECGNTRVICTASVEEKVPHFLRGSESGWITSEYGMLPRSTGTRMIRESSKGRPSGRTQEIQRLIGRALRCVAQLQALGERTIWIDCDVIQADGGTRTASITGSFVALALAIERLREARRISAPVIRDYLAAISVGIVEGQSLLDLNYQEDSSAEVDMNVVMTGKGAFVELQGTAERSPFQEPLLHQMLGYAHAGIEELIQVQRQSIVDSLGRPLELALEETEIVAGD